jgi:hypothetical protein
VRDPGGEVEQGVALRPQLRRVREPERPPRRALRVEGERAGVAERQAPPLRQRVDDRVGRGRAEADHLAAGQDRREDGSLRRCAQHEVGVRRGLLERLQQRVRAFVVQRFGALQQVEAARRRDGGERKVFEGAGGMAGARPQLPDLGLLAVGDDPFDVGVLVRRDPAAVGAVVAGAVVAVCRQLFAAGS